MNLNVRNIDSPKSLSEALKKIKPIKKLDAKKHLGKVKWHEHPLEYQKRLRDEWG